MTETTPRTSKMPAFETLDEEAAFWDEHDTTEFADEWEPVEVEVVQPLRHGLTVTLDTEEFHRLLAIAKERGISIIALAELWVRESLVQAEASAQPTQRERTTA